MSTITSLNHIPSITTGRRLCTAPHHTGQRWLPVSYFHVAEWTDATKTVPKRLQAHCKTCQVITQRKRKGCGPRKPSTTGYKLETPKDREIYNEYQRQRYHKLTDQQRDDRRERERIRAEGKRREAGIQPRKFRKHQMDGRLRPEPAEPTFPATPLAEFVTEMMHRHGVTAIANAAKVGTDRIQAIADEQEPTVTLELADRVLTGLGYPELLATMYPGEDE